MDYLRGVLGLTILVALAYLFSGNRKRIDWKLVGTGILLQLIFGLLIGKVPFVQSIFQVLSSGFVKFLGFALEGAAFLYGDLARNSEGVPGVKHDLGFLFAFQALPSVIFFFGSYRRPVLLGGPSENCLWLCLDYVQNYASFRSGKPLCRRQYLSRTNGGPTFGQAVHFKND